MHFKAKMKEEIKGLKHQELIDRLNKVNLELAKGKMEISRSQNPYGKDNISGKHDMKKLRYIKALVTNRLLQISKDGDSHE